MYTCPLHQWASYECPCPACVTTVVAVTTSGESLPPHPEKGEAKGMEEVLEQFEPNREYPSYYHEHDVLQAMSEWASIVSAEKDGTIKGLREALERIANPIKWMQDNLQEGETINGVYANLLANDGNYLSGIASQALNK